MLAVYCPAHRSRVLLSAGRIDRVSSSPDAVVVHWRCWCGHAGSTVNRRRCRHTHLPEAG